MNKIQNFFKLILGNKIFEKIENESKKWFIECDKCSYSISYWEAGGLRAWATKKKAIWGRCPTCKEFKWFKVVKKI